MPEENPTDRPPVVIDYSEDPSFRLVEGEYTQASGVRAREASDRAGAVVENTIRRFLERRDEALQEND
ncbi:MAG: hypothetical protein WC777_04580 [Candidatus Gracilibacteria bacterium]|jgi:hypothetical protein